MLGFLCGYSTFIGENGLLYGKRCHLVDSGIEMLCALVENKNFFCEIASFTQNYITKVMYYNNITIAGVALSDMTSMKDNENGNFFRRNIATIVHVVFILGFINRTFFFLQIPMKD